MSGRKSGCGKFSIPPSEPASASNEPPPIRCPPSQLSSMKRRIEVWSVIALSTKFFLA
jgi:hypothetical protein